MPDCKDARVVVLCEDIRHYHFVRGFLMARGVRPDRITPRIAPPGSGSGEHFVREQFPLELKAHRARRGNVVLVVCVDQDRSAQDRARKLADACADRGVAIPAGDDRLLVLVPTRNIETWLYLIEHGAAVDETSDYKPRCRDAKPGKLGRRLAADCPTLELTPSLKNARRDWRRLCG
jgi:hypothetical protein